MSENPNDPAGTTHQFRAFVNRGQQDQSAKSGPSTAMIVGIAAVVLIVVVALLAVLVL